MVEHIRRYLIALPALLTVSVRCPSHCSCPCVKRRSGRALALREVRAPVHSGRPVGRRGVLASWRWEGPPARPTVSKFQHLRRHVEKVELAAENGFGVVVGRQLLRRRPRLADPDRSSLRHSDERGDRPSVATRTFGGVHLVESQKDTGCSRMFSQRTPSMLVA